MQIWCGPHHMHAVRAAVHAAALQPAGYKGCRHTSWLLAITVNAAGNEGPDITLAMCVARAPGLACGMIPWCQTLLPII